MFVCTATALLSTHWWLIWLTFPVQQAPLHPTIQQIPWPGHTVAAVWSCRCQTHHVLGPSWLAALEHPDYNMSPEEIVRSMLFRLQPVCSDELPTAELNFSELHFLCWAGVCGSLSGPWHLVVVIRLNRTQLCILQLNGFWVWLHPSVCMWMMYPCSS